MSLVASCTTAPSNVELFAGIKLRAWSFNWPQPCKPSVQKRTLNFSDGKIEQLPCNYYYYPNRAKRRIRDGSPELNPDHGSNAKRFVRRRASRLCAVAVEETGARAASDSGTDKTQGRMPAAAAGNVGVVVSVPTAG